MSDSHHPPSEETTSHEHNAEDIAKHLGIYWAIGGMSMVLTAITVIMSFVTKGSVLVAMIFAACNAGMMAWFLMHLREEKSDIRHLVMVTLGAAASLFCLTLWCFKCYIHQ